MSLAVEEILTDSPLVEMVWHNRSDRAESFISQAINHWEIVVWTYEGKTHVSLRGPETRATPAASQAGGEYLGIQFRLGAYMPHLPTVGRVDGDIVLPEAGSRSVWLNGSAWQIPGPQDADAFVNRLERQGLVELDPVVQAVLRGRPQMLSDRTVRRRFLHAVGLTPKTHGQIERARRAAHLLGQGTPIADVVFETGYADQPHLTRSLKHFLGRTPALILSSRDVAPQLSAYRWRDKAE